MNAPLILVAEKHQHLRQELRLSLESEGFKTMLASSPADVWRAVEDHSVGAFVLDTALRGPDGMDLCRDVRARSNVPIILVGEHSSEVDRVVGLELGADDYMNKPYSPREVVARLRAVMRRGKNDRSTQGAQLALIQFDGWSFDPLRHELTDPNGSLVALTSAEFALLGILINHAHSVVSRAAIIDCAGSLQSQVSDRSVDVLVSRLRRKLSFNRRPAPILTVRGVGYMFSASLTTGC